MDEWDREALDAAAIEQLPLLLARYAETWRTGAEFDGRDWRLELTDARGRRYDASFDFSLMAIREADGSVQAVLAIGHDATVPASKQRHLEASELLVEFQDALLPRGLPMPQGVQLAARSLLADDETGAGGDWFDAIPLPDGHVVVVVGDVVGHGIEASVTMGELKALFDEEVRNQGDLMAALELLDARAARVPEARTATVCACVLDTRTGELSYCTAGHPPPIVVTADGQASYLPVSGAGPLGSGHGFATERHRMAEGDLLLLYSDGLVERPGRSLAQNTVELLRVAEDAVREDGSDTDEQLVERVSRHALERLTARTGYADDITLLALQVVPPTPPLELHLPAVPDAVRTVRADLADWLARLRVGALEQTAVQHAVGELVSNAVTHAYHTVDVRNPVDVTVCLTIDGELEVVVADRGRWREPAPGAGGQGLAMVSGFLDELMIEQDDTGTRARGWYRLSHAASLLRGTTPPAFEPRTPAFGLAVHGDAVHAVGALDLHSADELRHACARASLGGTRLVTVDLAEVDVLSSAAVQALYDARDAGPMDLVAPMGSPAQHVLELVHLPYRG